MARGIGGRGGTLSGSSHSDLGGSSRVLTHCSSWGSVRLPGQCEAGTPDNARPLPDIPEVAAAGRASSGGEGSAHPAPRGMERSCLKPHHRAGFLPPIHPVLEVNWRVNSHAPAR
jgi:hypothetical protein